MYILNIKEKQYKCKLAFGELKALQHKYGVSYLEMIQSQLVDNEKMVELLQACLVKYQHDIKIEDVYNIVDDYLDEKDLQELYIEILLILQASGYMRRDIDIRKLVMDEQARQEELMKEQQEKELKKTLKNEKK